MTTLKNWQTIKAEKIAQTPEIKKHMESERRLLGLAMNLSDLRREQNLTQTDVAKQLGITQETVSSIERGSDPKLSTLARYIEALGGHLELNATFDNSPNTKNLTSSSS